MKYLNKLLHFFLAISMGFLCFMPTFANETINPDELGNVFVTLYQKEENDNLATGLESDDPHGVPIEGMEFTLYPVMNTEDTIAYYNGNHSDSLSVLDFLVEDEIDSSKIIDKESIQVKETDADGKCSFTNLNVGMYVLVQTNVPFNVLEKAPATLISIPFTINNEWHYDAYVYPKSEVTLDDQLEIIKYGNGLPNQEGSIVLEGVTFSLLKKGKLDDWSDASSITNQSLVTNAEGKIFLNGLKNGEYCLKEESVGKNEGYIKENTSFDFKVVRGKVVFDDDFVLDHSYMADGKCVSYVAVDEHSLSIANYRPVIKKSLENDDSIIVGKSVKYKIEASIPLNIAKLNAFYLIDTPQNMEFDETDEIIVTVKDSNEVIPDSFYSIEKDEKTKGFKLTFNNYRTNSIFLEDWQEYAGKSIVITYHAILLPEAIQNSNSFINSVSVYYSSVTNTEGNIDTIEPGPEIPPVEIHTFDLEITKILKGLEDNKSKKGVSFEMFDGSSRLSFDLIDGIYYINPKGSVFELVTDQNGKIFVSGIGNGNYSLKETKTIYDYNLLKDLVNFTVSFDANINPTDSNSLNLVNGRLQLEIVNKKGIELPNTSGFTLIFISLFGIVLLFIGFTYINLHHREEE